MNTIPVDIILRRLEELKELDSALEVFGARSHRYAFNPVVAEAKLKAFEKRYRCKLPRDYREFLKIVGNGGAGPGYGLFPLGLMDDAFDLAEWYLDAVRPDLEFPFSGVTNDTSMLGDGEPQQADYAIEADYNTAYDAWWDQVGEQRQQLYWEKHALNGAIPIVHHGCAQRSWLVVAEGAEYGNVWEDQTADHAGVFPVNSAAKGRYSFSEWYIKWLDESALRCQARFSA